MVHRASYWGLLEIKGECTIRMNLVANMHEQETINTVAQKDFLNWGSMRVDLAHEEFMFKQRNHMEHPLGFPKLQIMREMDEVPQAKETGDRLSMDFCEDNV